MLTITRGCSLNVNPLLEDEAMSKEFGGLGFIAGIGVG